MKPWNCLRFPLNHSCQGMAGGTGGAELPQLLLQLLVVPDHLSNLQCLSIHLEEEVPFRGVLCFQWLWQCGWVVGTGLGPAVTVVRTSGHGWVVGSQT